MTAHPEASARLGRLRGFLEADPGNAALLAECAGLALQLGLEEDALSWTERALAAGPGDPQLQEWLAGAKLALRYRSGRALLHAGRYREARDSLASIVDDPQAPSDTRHLLVRALHYLGEVKEAIEHANKHAEANPDDAAAAGSLSLLYLDANDLPEAKRWSERALAGQPSNLDALLAAGTVAVGYEKEDEAERAFERALELSPTNGRAWAGLGIAAILKFDLASARGRFEKALADMPESGGTWNALAWCQMLEKDYAAAAASLERSMAINRNIGDTHGGFAMLCALQGRWDEAEHHTKRARALDPRAFGAAMARVLKAQEAGEGDLARERLLRGLASVAAPGGGTLADMLARTMLKRSLRDDPAR
jgi:tetratricopeptide (TPR) repeat protein